jgi:hypothetical protein
LRILSMNSIFGVPQPHCIGTHSDGAEPLLTEW